MKGEKQFVENELEPHKTTYHVTVKWLLYQNKDQKEYETGGKIAPIHQETKVEEVAAQDNKAIRRNE